MSPVELTPEEIVEFTALHDEDCFLRTHNGACDCPKGSMVTLLVNERRTVHDLADRLMTSADKRGEIVLRLAQTEIEIREVLERLRHQYSGCWCPNRHPKLEETMPHEPACLATRVLWERVRGTVSKEESDVNK